MILVFISISLEELMLAQTPVKNGKYLSITLLYNFKKGHVLVFLLLPCTCTFSLR